MIYQPMTNLTDFGVLYCPNDWLNVAKLDEAVGANGSISMILSMLGKDFMMQRLPHLFNNVIINRIRASVYHHRDIDPTVFQDYLSPKTTCPILAIF